MSLVWTEDEAALAEAARSWVAAEAPIARFRAMRDRGIAFDRALWDELVGLGWPAVGLESDGMGLPARVAIAEALGWGLVATPLLSCWLGADLDPQADAASGEVRALCWEEAGSRGDPSRVSARVVDGRLTGSKVGVIDAEAASTWLVTAREGGVVGLYRVAREFGTVTTLRRVDARDAADVRFDGAPCERIGELSAVEAALDRAALVLAAEMLGGADRALQTTLDYVKTRQQFGVAIGSFQVLQHRLVDCFVAVELLRSAVLAGARDPSVANCALAKAHGGDTYVKVAYEAIQLHGGIGVTDDCDVGFHLKRARVADRLFGTASWHRDRWGRAHGY